MNKSQKIITAEMSKIIQVLLGKVHAYKAHLVKVTKYTLFPSIIHNSIVLQNGKIHPMGVIRILDAKHGDVDNDMVGLEIWSPKLMPYGNGNFRADIQDDHIRVFRKNTDEVIEVIPHQDCVSPEVWQNVVVEEGFLDCVGPMMFLFDTPIDGFPVAALQKAVRGENPGYCDIRRFTRVDPKYEGEIFFTLEFGEIHNEDILVFSKDGNLIDSETDHWLSSKRWGGKTPEMSSSVQDDEAFV